MDYLGHSDQRNLSQNAGQMATATFGQLDSHRPIQNARLRRAVELKFAQPGESWTNIAQQVGCGRKTLWTWRQSPEWEACWRELSNEYMDELVPYALRGLKKIFESGRGEAQMLEVLRAAGLLAPPQSNIGITMQGPSLDVTEVRERVLARLAQLSARAEDTTPPEPLSLNGRTEADDVEQAQD